MRKLVAPALLSAIALSAALVGCKASVQIGSKEPAPKKTAQPAPPPPPPPPPAQTAAPAKPKLTLNLAKFKKVGNEIELPSPVPFKVGSSELDKDAGADEILELVRKYMAENPDVTLLRIEGHTDSDGDDAKNLQLSKDRSMSVSKWLTEKGVECKRLLPVGFGEARPLAANDTAENKAKNRRVSFFDAAVKGKPVKDEKTKKDIPVDNGAGKDGSAGDPCPRLK